MRFGRIFSSMLLAAGMIAAARPSQAGVFISVGIAPPPMPVYVQPPCPEPDMIWTPGYWAYGEDGYYWVPGAWVPSPEPGLLWTPGYWGWGGGVYVWHAGYWGPHVGYYGGVNYGFGYMGVGFVGGMWDRGHFRYNTDVVRVNNVYIHNTYVDHQVVVRNTIINDRHVAFAGGPGGIHHDPRPEERFADHDRHIDRSSFQDQHEHAAHNDHGAYFNNNHGHPQNTAMQRPAGWNNNGNNNNHIPQQQHGLQPNNRPAYQDHAQPQNHPDPRNSQWDRPEQHNNARPDQHMQQGNRPSYDQPQRNTQPQQHAQPQSHPESRPAPKAEPKQEREPKEHSRR